MHFWFSECKRVVYAYVLRIIAHILSGTLIVNYNEIIKEVGRGKHGATDLSEATAFALFTDMLEGRVPDLELGALLVALRIKGESEAEMLGFYRAMQASKVDLGAPQGQPRPVLLPTYNGARRRGNLTPLLALMLRQLGVPVLVHGVRTDPKRVTSMEVFQHLGLPPAENLDAAQQALDDGRVAFVPIDVLSPGLDRLLQLRWRLGVRGSTHTLVKLLNPFATEAVRVVSVSHPEYLGKMALFFQQTQTCGLLLRGTEGEPYANPKRCPRLTGFFQGEERVLVDAEEGVIAEMPVLPEEMDAEITTRWIARALRGEVPIPQPLLQQAACCLVLSGAVPDLATAQSRIAETPWA
jgi:anthranilate phosphoribosyltransferase